MLKVHYFPPSPRAFKVLAVLHHLELPFEPRVIDLFKGEQKQPEFAALNPNMMMPVIEDDGFVLWEANAILQYLASKNPARGLLPEEPKARADVSRWQFWDLAHWEPSMAVMIFERVVKKLASLGEPDLARTAEAETRFHRFARVLDTHLGGRRFVTGDRLTVADFSLGPALNLAGPAQIPVADYPEIRRWHASLMALPAWQKTLALVAPR
jgi:glutathione S-transferase